MENLFPFANVPTTDPFTGITDNRYAKCQYEQHVPARRGDLFGERVLGQDRVAAAHEARTVRRIFRSRRSRALTSCRACSTAPAARRQRGNCQQFQNPLSSNPVQRALWLCARQVDVRSGARRRAWCPRLDNGTLALPANTGFPTNIPDSFSRHANGKVTYTGLKSPRYRYVVARQLLHSPASRRISRLTRRRTRSIRRRRHHGERAALSELRSGDRQRR
jgi:hypothetical protein